MRHRLSRLTETLLRAVGVQRRVMRHTRRWQEGEWHFAVRACGNGVSGYLCWAKRQPIVADDPIREPGQVWFEFGGSADEAVQKLRDEVFALAA